MGAPCQADNRERQRDRETQREKQRETHREIVKGGFWQSSGMVFVIIAIMLSGYMYAKRAPSMSL